MGDTQDNREVTDLAIETFVLDDKLQNQEFPKDAPVDHLIHAIGSA
jgi:hypothetical protein